MSNDDFFAVVRGVKNRNTRRALCLWLSAESRTKGWEVAGAVSFHFCFSKEEGEAEKEG